MIKRNLHPVDELELMAYLDGELSRERAAATAAHLEACSECRALANELGGVSKELAKWRVETADLQIMSRLSAALDDHERNHQNSRWDRRVGTMSLRRFWPWALTATAGILAVATFSFLRVPGRAVEYSSFWTGRHQTRELQGPAEKKPRSYHSVPSLAPQPSVETKNAPLDSNGLFRSAGDHALNDVVRSGSSSGVHVSAGPMIVHTAEITLTTTDFDRSRSRIEEILKQHNGYIGDLNVTGAASSARTLTATLRVPSSQLDATIAEMKSLGRVEAESQKGEEVSQQYVDLQARLLNSRNSEQRLTELLRRAGKLSDVLAVEEQIENVRENIERMEAERKNLAKQVEFSTVDVRVAEDFKESVHVVPDSTSTRFRNAAVEGYEVMVAGLINLLLFLISWGPSLLLWGAILFFPVRWLWRRRQREIF